MAGPGIRKLKRIIRNFRRLHHKSTIRNRKLGKMIDKRETKIKESLEMAREARAVQDKKLGLLQADLNEKQVEIVRLEEVNHATKMEVKHMHREYTRVKIKTRNRKLQIQELHQNLNQITQERDNALQELWTIETKKWEEAHDYEIEIHDYEVETQNLQAQVHDPQAHVHTLQAQLAEAQAQAADQFIEIEEDPEEDPGLDNDDQAEGDVEESEAESEVSDASPGPHHDSP